MKPLLKKGTHKDPITKLYAKNNSDYWISYWRDMKIFNNISN
jgi:hypothetical protein